MYQGADTMGGGLAMQKSKSEMPLPPQMGLSQGVAASFKDLLSLRKYDPPFFEVGEPKVKSGAASKHTVYTVKGTDHLGEFSILRRFREFDTLRKTFYSRFLGLYIPPIPEKQAMVSNPIDTMSRATRRACSWRSASSSSTAS